MFKKEEELVFNEYQKICRDEYLLILDACKLLENLIYQTKVPPENFGQYSCIILAGLNLKSINSAIDRLSKGYISDSEAIFKKFIESFLISVFLYENPDKAELWIKGTSIQKLKIDRRKMSQKLDLLNSEKRIFPTDYPNFFESYIYDVGYVNSNIFAHLDFNYVHKELGLEDDSRFYATTLVVGPRFHSELMKKVSLRIMMFAMFQTSYLKETFKLNYDEEHSQILQRIIKKMSEL